MFNLNAIEESSLLDFRTVLMRHEYHSDAIQRWTREWPKSFLRDTLAESAYEYFFASKPKLLLLLKLFLSQQFIKVDLLAPLFPDRLMNFLIGIGLLQKRDNELRCPFLIFPIENYYIVTDRWASPRDLNPVFELEWEQNLLANAMVRDRAADALDLCTGCGVFAILASGFCSKVYAVDVNPRAVGFACFNARLNGINNIKCVEGDLFEPVNDLTFDVIYANPPYNPACTDASRNLITSIHGGFSGEEVLFRILGGLEAHLRIGGMAQISTRIFSDHRSPYSNRLNTVLNIDRFDAFLMQTPPREIFTLSNLIASAWSVERRNAHLLWEYYKSHGISRESFGILSLRRVEEGGTFREISLDHNAFLTDQDRSWVVRDHLKQDSGCTSVS
jgi:carbamoyltransferase